MHLPPMTGLAERKALHDLVDALPDTDLPRVLAMVRGEMNLVDDELTPDEEARIESAKASARDGRVVSQDDVMRRYGLTDE